MRLPDPATHDRNMAYNCAHFHKGVSFKPISAPLLEKCDISEPAISPKCLFICKETKVRTLRFTDQLSNLTLEASRKKIHHESGEPHAPDTFHGFKEQYV
jgi:hypothetical protein